MFYGVNHPVSYILIRRTLHKKTSLPPCTIDITRTFYYITPLVFNKFRRETYDHIRDSSDTLTGSIVKWYFRLRPGLSRLTSSSIGKLVKWLVGPGDRESCNRETLDLI